MYNASFQERSDEDRVVRSDSPLTVATHDLTETKLGSRLEKLPRVEAAPVGVVDVRVRPILENSTACTKSNAKNPAHHRLVM
jgi:hypothetical protein